MTGDDEEYVAADGGGAGDEADATGPANSKAPMIPKRARKSAPYRLKISGMHTDSPKATRILRAAVKSLNATMLKKWPERSK